MYIRESTYKKKEKKDTQTDYIVRLSLYRITLIPDYLIGDNMRDLSGTAVVVICVGFTALMVANWYFYTAALLGW